MGSRVLLANDHPLQAPRQVTRPFMVQRWTDLTFLHWPADPGEVQTWLPPGLRVDTFEGQAWIGIIPFHLQIRMPAAAPTLPWLSGTAEINVRTYVRGPDGRPGIWFFSLDASRLAVAATARAWYRIPYIWARIRMSRTATSVSYTSRRRTRPGRHLQATIDIGEPVHELSNLERFLTCRWHLYSPRRGGRFFVSDIDHEPWPLFRARASGLEQTLLPVAGSPLVHFSPGVGVRWERRVRCGPPPPA